MSEGISVFPVSSSPYKVSYVEWTVRWWKWLLGMPRSQNPALDLTGKRAYNGQTDPHVFFLCQTFGTHDRFPIRHVLMPNRKAIFVPIINWISVAPEDGVSERELLVTAKRKIDTIETLNIVVNSSKINIHPDLDRVTSGTFDVYLPKDNILNAQEGYVRCLSDGFYLFFIPTQTQVTLSSYGSCSSGINKIGVMYSIDFG